MNKPKKPSIAPGTQLRIRRFVKEVETLQRRWGVQLSVAEGKGYLVISDARRKTPWLQPDGSIYGTWDAYVAESYKPGAFRLNNIHMEDFGAWGK